MKPFRLSHLLAVVLLPVLGFAAAEKASVADLLKDAKKLDQKEVEVKGSLREFKQRTSKIGNKYFTFRLKDGDQSVNVFSRGALETPPKDGAKVTVVGIYRAENKVGDNVFKNEIDCSPKEGKKFGVKELK
jgi:hypothetical protein